MVETPRKKNSGQIQPHWAQPRSARSTEATLYTLVDEGGGHPIKFVAQHPSRRFKVRPGRVLSVLLLSSAALLGGCAYLTVPSDGYPATSESIRTRVAQMKADPKGVRRPVIVIDGWLPIGSADTMQRELAALTGATNGQFVKHSYLPAFSTLEGNAGRIVEKVERRWPSTDPEWTVEVDAVCFSMGGIIGRVAALEPRSGTQPRKRLQIRTLYTISTPHSGVGWWLGWVFVGEMSFNTSRYAGDNRRLLDAAQATAGYELLCYGQGNDWVAGRNTAPAGYQTMEARGTIILSHITSFGNYRHLADIAARLRGEAPLVEAAAGGGIRTRNR